MESKPKTKKAVTLNWSQHFEPQFIRGIEAIKRHDHPLYGHIESGHYLNEKTLDADGVYKTGELFLVMERREVANRSEILPFMKGTLSPTFSPHRCGVAERFPNPQNGRRIPKISLRGKQIDCRHPRRPRFAQQRPVGQIGNNVSLEKYK